MDFILEIIFELLFEGIIAVIQNKKISKWIRYPLLGIISVCYTALFFLIFFLSIKLLKDSILLFILFFVISIFILILFLSFLKKVTCSKE